MKSQKIKKDLKNLSEDQILHLETIEHLEDQVCKGNISNEEFFNGLDNIKEAFKN